ncbi:MAG: hypothetical protein H0U00_13700, partial [Actinobacteria bacterium]|nr:hypothetical protein [Actinomycetota bacterium]
MSVNDMESFSGTPPEAEPAADKERERDERPEDDRDESTRVAVCGRLRRMRRRRPQARDRVVISALGCRVLHTA